MTKNTRHDGSENDPAHPDNVLGGGNGQGRGNGDASADLPAVEPLEANDGNAPDDGAAILDDVATFIDRFCAFPSASTASVLALWAAWTHMFEDFHSGPRIALLSPEVGSGKTRVLEVLETLVQNPLPAAHITAAPLFRTLDQHPTTLLLDEADKIFGRFGNDDENKSIQMLLNVGYKKHSIVPRCVGESNQVKHFDAYAPAALAGVGELPESLMSRSIIVWMRRRAPDEHVESWEGSAHEPEGHALRDRLAAWTETAAAQASAARPELPPGVEDRPAELWRPIVAVADAAGGHWPETARAACREWTATVERPRSPGIQLLADLRYVFDCVYGGAGRLATDDILTALHAFEESPWSDIKGRPLDARGLARRLAEHGIRPTKVKMTDGRGALKGYRREDFVDAWSRYLPRGPVWEEPGEPQEPSRNSGISEFPSGSPGSPDGAEGGTSKPPKLSDGSPGSSSSSHTEPPGATGAGQPASPQREDTNAACPDCGAEFYTVGPAGTRCAACQTRLEEERGDLPF
jgi:hypothetical protein